MYSRIEGYSVFKEDLEHIANHIAPLREKLRGANILITGSTGFFGIWLVEGLLYANTRENLNMTITAMSRDPERFLKAGGKHLVGKDGLVWIKGSMTDFDQNIGPFNYIIHAASETNLENTSDWARRHLVAALDGTNRILELAARGKNTSLLLTTSGAIYGQPDAVIDQRCTEGFAGISDFAGEKNVYGQAKRMMETMSVVAARDFGFSTQIARCFAFVGPYLSLDSNYAIGNFIRDAMAGQPIVISGDGTPLRTYLYSADLVIWLMTILTNGTSGRPYNVGGEQAYSIKELAELVNECAGGQSAVIVKQQPKSGAVPHAYMPSITRAKDELQLEPFIPLPEAIKRTIAWHTMRQKSS